jgi:hypothetical protein
MKIRILRMQSALKYNKFTQDLSKLVITLTAGDMNILSWWAMAPDRETPDSWRHWATDTNSLDEVPTGLPATPHIPMMSSRRMSAGTRLAVESAMTLLDEHQADLAIFTSRHGELERTYKILQHLQQQQALSPTDFVMSVHNTAAGWLTITAKNTLPTTSLAAGEDSFQQGMIEAQCILASSDAKRVLLVDFDGVVPEVYQSFSPANYYPYAVAFLLEAGDTLSFQPESLSSSTQRAEPQSLIFLRAWLNQQVEFVVPGVRQNWRWVG